MQKHLLISVSLLLVCQFALTQQNLRLTDASSAQVYWQANDVENAKIKTKKVQKAVLESKENPIKNTIAYQKRLEIAHSNQNFYKKTTVNTKDKAYESRFLFGGQRAVLLAYYTRSLPMAKAIGYHIGHRYATVFRVQVA
jgi:hypothetical protein